MEAPKANNKPQKKKSGQWASSDWRLAKFCENETTVDEISSPKLKDIRFVIEISIDTN